MSQALFKHILCPVDFSPQCVETLRLVRQWVDRYQAKVSLLHTVEFGHASYINWYAYIALVDLESVRTDARRRMKDLAASAFDGCNYHIELTEGDPAQAISIYAKDNGVDLIMMPTTGQGRLRRLLIGSVTAKVVYDADCPVWTDTHRHGEEEIAGHVEQGPLLCAVDGTEGSLDAIRMTAAIARAEGAGLELLHVIPSVWVDPELQPATAQNLQSVLEADALRRLSDLQVRAGVECPAAVTHGDIPKALRTEAEKRKARLIVIGRGHMHGVLGRMRTHVNSIIERAPCPVLSV
ncbi:MAG: universal stress protein [Bryobacteraceae bacterium]|nr:universal stress protein [Bryobacteraceae bacterium]